MKKENIKNKLKGILIILIGLVLAAVGVWLYSKVWGINLLFTDSSLGKVARFYWIFLIAAVIVVALGIRKFRKRVIVEQETENSAQMRGIRSASGKVCPVSHLLTACRDTSSISAICSCESPAARRSAAIRSPMVIRFILLCLLFSRQS